MTVYMYHKAMEMLFIEKHKQANSSELPFFVKKNAKTLEFTDHEKSALAVFGVTIALSIIEIVLTTAICTHSSASYARPLSLPTHRMQNQVSRTCGHGKHYCLNKTGQWR